MKTAWWAIVLVVICTFFVSSAQVFYKFASAKLPEIMTNWQLFSGIALYAIGALLLIVAFKYGEVSVLNPVFATSYIWVILFSNFFFNEPVTLTKVLGAAVIIAGITFVSIGSRKGSALEYAGEL